MAEYILYYIKNYFEKIKSKYILKKIFNNVQEKIVLQIFKYNKNIQKKIDININNYIKYSQIEIEIITTGSGKFINIKKKEKKFFHIYKKHKDKKIIILIDHNVDSLNCLFKECQCIESINFKRFNRNNIYSMKNMFAFIKINYFIKF